LAHLHRDGYRVLRRPAIGGHGLAVILCAEGVEIARVDTKYLEDGASDGSLSRMELLLQAVARHRMLGGTADEVLEAVDAVYRLPAWGLQAEHCSTLPPAEHHDHIFRTAHDGALPYLRIVEEEFAEQLSPKDYAWLVSRRQAEPETEPDSDVPTG